MILIAIIKLSASGKQWQLVLSEDLPAGTVLGVGKGSLTQVLMGSIPFSLLSILPMSVSPSRYPKSSVWGSDDSQVQAYKDKLSAFQLGGQSNELPASRDGLSKSFTKERKQKKTYSGKVVL